MRHFIRFLPLTACFTFALLEGGCLEARQGGHQGATRATGSATAADTGDNSTRDDTTTDSNASTTATAQDTGPTDTCGPGVPVSEPPQCQDDADCNDGNPCSDDHCIARAPVCGYVSTYCSNAIDESCGCGSDAACDDHEPCTTDRCVADAAGVSHCQNVHLSGGGCANLCAPSGASVYADIAPGGFGSVIGHAQADLFSNGCALPAGSEAGGPAQVACISDLLLFDGMQAVTLADPTGAQRMQCETTGFVGGVPPFCTPLHANVEYVAWGTAVRAEVAAAPGFQAFDVDGYCLSTRGGALAGNYDVHIEFAGESASERVALAYEPGPNGGPGRLVTVAPLSATCAWPCLGQLAEWLWIQPGDGDAHLAMTWRSDSPDIGPQTEVTLVSTENRLVGSFDLGTSRATIVFERLPDSP